MSKKEEQPKPIGGDVWKDNDKRVGKRLITVRSVDERYVYFECNGRASRAQKSRFDGTAQGYSIVSRHGKPYWRVTSGTVIDRTTGKPVEGSDE